MTEMLTYETEWCEYLSVIFIYLFVCSFQALHLSAADILHSQIALFPFMQFMRSEAALNVLQFCLTVGERSFLASFLSFLSHCWHRN